MPQGMALVYVLGAAQGAFLAAVLASRRRNPVPNRLLGAVMLAFSVDLSMAAYHASGYDEAFPALIGLDVPLGLLYGPLLYLYVRTLSERERLLRRVDTLHLVPFALLFAFILPFFALGGAEKVALLEQPGSDPWTRGLAVVNPLKLVHGLVYVGLVIALLRRHRARVRGRLSDVERVTLNWLRNLTVGTAALTGVTAVLYVLAARGAVPLVGLDPTQGYDDYTLLAVAVFVYAVGYMGMRQPEVLVSGPPEAEGRPAEQPRYAKSGMDAETAERHLAALLALMEEGKPYRRGDLTLQDLAGSLGVSEHNLTEVLSTQVGQTFYDFVNGYRVREVQERLRDPEAAHLTVLAVGLDAGFNSKSTFNAVFKKHAGTTPSEYRRRGQAA